jgi:hypothetical protein
MKKRERDNRRPVVKVVHDIMEQARLARGEGPTSSIYRRETQMSNAISQAGVMLAKMDPGGARGRKPSALQSLLGSVGAQPKPKRRSWFFASSGSASMPDAKRIDQLLKAALKDGKPLALDQIAPDAPTNDDMICHLPDGAGDPVCEPR